MFQGLPSPQEQDAFLFWVAIIFRGPASLKWTIVKLVWSQQLPPQYTWVWWGCTAWMGQPVCTEDGLGQRPECVEPWELLRCLPCCRQEQPPCVPKDLHGEASLPRHLDFSGR